MKIINQRAFRISQEISREAVEKGSNEGYEFDWHSAMLFLKAAYGYLSINELEAIGAHDD